MYEGLDGLVSNTVWAFYFYSLEFIIFCNFQNFFEWFC